MLLYGPPGTGKTLLARAMAKNVEANFMKVVASAIVDKYIGESARVIREMFGMSRNGFADVVSILLVAHFDVDLSGCDLPSDPTCVCCIRCF